jgi:hypothetical protein
MWFQAVLLLSHASWSMNVEYSDTRKVSGCLLATVQAIHREPVIVWLGPGGAAYGSTRLTELGTSSRKVWGSMFGCIAGISVVDAVLTPTRKILLSCASVMPAP